MLKSLQYWTIGLLGRAIRAMYDWVMDQVDRRHATWSLFAVAFAESSFFPIPPDVMLWPMTAKRPDRAYFYAFICTLASVLGGIAGYAIGYYLTGIGEWILNTSGNGDGVAEFQKLYDQWGLWVILVKGLTPIPFKLVTIASGVAHFNLAVFIAACTVTRGGRFFLTAFVLRRFGPAMLKIIEKRLMLATFIILALLIGGVLLVKLI